MSLSVITSRPWRPWPQIHWVVREVPKVVKSKGRFIEVWITGEDYELVWPWMKCQGIGIHKGG